MTASSTGYALRWGRLTAIGVGTLLGVLFASWLATGSLWDRPPRCVVWSRGGSTYYCTGWSE